MDVKVGDIIMFKSTGYKPDGEWSNEKFLQSAMVSKVQGKSVEALRPGQRPWDYIKKDEIVDVWHKELITDMWNIIYGVNNFGE